MNEPQTCLICLDSPQDKNPLHLLSCGCKTAWFHSTCADMWLSHIPLADYPPECPTCKRYVMLKIKYSFQFKDGINQKYLWFTLSLFPAELLFALNLFFQIHSENNYALYIPCQSICLFTIPFIIRSKHNMNFFLHNYRFKVFFEVLIILFNVLKNKSNSYLFVDNYVTMIVLLNFAHFICLFLLHVNDRWNGSYEYMDLYLPYVKGYEFEYVETSLTTPKSVTSSTETNKPILRRSSRIRNRSSSL